MVRLYRLVLVSDLHDWIEKGWTYDGRGVAKCLGGPEWASVYVWKEV